MTNDNIVKTSIDNLLKIAQDMAEMAGDQTSQKSSPEDVLEGLNQVISALSQIADSLPVSDKPQPDEGATPPGQEAPQVAQLQAQLKEITQKLALKEKSELATKYAELYDEKEFETKFKQVMESDVKPEIWTAKIEAIEEVRNQLPEHPSSRIANSFSYTKMAKLNDSGILVL